MYIDITTKNELLAHESDIKELFLASFGKNISSNDWRWLYIDNPTGPAHISLFYDNNQLLGHYAVVPTLLKCKDESFIAYRSMTTMVHPDGRGRGLFLDLANRVYAARQDKNASLVYGFPNKNVADARSKYLKWTLTESDRIIDFLGSEILSDTELCEVLTTRADIEWDSTETNQAEWRVKKPNTRFICKPGLVAKLYEDAFNILHLNREGLDYIEHDKKYRLLVPAAFKPEVMQERAVFNYQFGFRIFDKKFSSAKIRTELIMSDVF